MRVLKSGAIKFSKRDIKRLKKTTKIRKTAFLLKCISNNIYGGNKLVSYFTIRWIVNIIYPNYPKRT